MGRSTDGGSDGRPRHPRRHSRRRAGPRAPARRSRGQGRLHHRYRRDQGPGRRDDRRRWPRARARHRRRAHPLRCPGHLGRHALAVALARRHHGGDGQLRLRHRAGAPHRARPGDPQPLRGRGHGPRPAAPGHHLGFRKLRRLPGDAAPTPPKPGRPFFQGTGMGIHHEQEPARALRLFDDGAAPFRRGSGCYAQLPCQPLSFDFTMANAYPFYSHSAFDPIKAYTPVELKAVFSDPSWRAKFREDTKTPRPGMIFQGNWDRVMVAVAHKASNAKYVNRYAAEIAASERRDPLDVVLDLSLDEELETAFLGRFLNVGDDGVAKLLKHEAGVVALSDAGAHLIYMCDACFGLHFLARWVRERGGFDIAQGVRGATSHPADLYGIPNRGRIAIGAQADLLLFDPATVGVSPAERVADLPGGGRRTIRRPARLHAVFRT